MTINVLNGLTQEALTTALTDICGAAYVQADAAIDEALLTDWLHSTGGPARAAVFPASVAEVSAVLALCHQHRIPGDSAGR